MACLLIRHAHSRFQLRRATGFTTVLGGVMIVLGCVGLLGTLLSISRENFSALIVPAVVTLGLGVGGLRVLGSGALLLEAQAGGTYVASIDRRVARPELRSVEVLWRFDSQRDKEVQVTLELQNASAKVTQSWLPFEDPGALARELSAQLGVPAQVEERTTS